MSSASDVSTEALPQVKPAQCRPAPLAAELRVALMRSVRRIRQQRSSQALTDGQYSVLAALFRGPHTPRELADREHVQPPSMTRTINALEEAGLVQRADDPHDRRQVIVGLTEQGRQEVKETLRRRDAWLAQQLAKLEPEERAVLAQAVEIMRRVIAQ